jgi:phage head maturation protease
MSFQVIIGRDGAKWDDSEKGKLPLRTIHSFAEIFDVSVVTFPAFEATEAELRSVTAEIDALRQAGKSALISEIELRRLKMKGRLSAVHGMAR